MEGELYNVQEGLEGELGYKGERGYSTYELAVLNGFEGTIQDYLDHYGVDLTGYIKTSDVVDDLTSTSTSYPLSANQGKALKTLVDGLDTSKADASDVYTKTDTYNKTEINALLEDINGDVLWVNSSPYSSFDAQTIQLDLTNYDRVDVISVFNYGGDNPQLNYVTLYKFNNTSSSSKGSEGKLERLGIYSIDSTNWYLQYSSRTVTWKSNGIQFGDGHYINTNSSSLNTSNYMLIPYVIIGRQTGVHDFYNQS